MNTVRLLMLVAVSAAFALNGMAFDSDTLAFYTFKDQAAGTEADGKTVRNAVDSSRFAGTCTKHSAKSSVMQFSDERPAKYLFAKRAHKAEMLVEEPISIHATVPGTWSAVGGGTIEFSDLATAIGGEGAWTVEFMYRLDQSHSGYNGYLAVPVLVNGTADTIVAVKTNDGQWRCHYDQAASWGIVNYPATLKDEKWHHLAMVYTGSKLRIVCDRTRSAEINCSGVTAAQSAALSLMGNYLHGYVTGLRVTKRALAVSEFLFASDDRNCMPGEICHFSLDGMVGQDLTEVPNLSGTYYANWASRYLGNVYSEEDYSGMATGAGKVIADGDRYPTCIATAPQGERNKYVDAYGDRREEVRNNGGVFMPISAGSGSVTGPEVRFDNYAVWENTGDLVGSFTMEGFFRFDWERFSEMKTAAGKPNWYFGLMGAYAGGGERPWFRLQATAPSKKGEYGSFVLVAARDSWQLQSSDGKTYTRTLLSDTDWHHICIQYDHANHKLTAIADYDQVLCELNPITMSTTDTTPGPLMTPNDGSKASAKLMYFSFGKCYGQEPGAFEMDELRLSRGLLTKEQMIHFYNPLRGLMNQVY